MRFDKYIMTFIFILVLGFEISILYNLSVPYSLRYGSLVYSVYQNGSEIPGTSNWDIIMPQFAEHLCHLWMMPDTDDIKITLNLKRTMNATCRESVSDFYARMFSGNDGIDYSHSFNYKCMILLFTALSLLGTLIILNTILLCYRSTIILTLWLSLLFTIKFFVCFIAIYIIVFYQQNNTSVFSLCLFLNISICIYEICPCYLEGEKTRRQVRINNSKIILERSPSDVTTYLINHTMQ